MKSETVKKPRSKGTSRILSGKGHSGDPFFIKKAEQSKKFLQKHGFPKELIQK